MPKSHAGPSFRFDRFVYGGSSGGLKNALVARCPAEIFDWMAHHLGVHFHRGSGEAARKVESA